MQHIMQLKSGASFKITVLEATDSNITYLSSDYKGTAPLPSIKEVKFIHSGYIDRPYGSSSKRGSHLLYLKSGASFSIFIISLTDSLVTYESDGVKGEVSVSEIKLLKIKVEPMVFRDPSENRVSFNLRRRQKDTTPIFKAKGITGFMEVGSKFGLVEEDQWTYPVMGLYLEGGLYIPKGKNFLLGASAGVHSFILYNAATMPLKVQTKYIFSPQKRRSIALNLGLGYGLQIADDNPLKKGGICFNYGISIAKSKSPQRVNEWNFGFSVDRFKSIRDIGRWDPFTGVFTSTSVEQFASARRFYISKKWWLK